MNDLDIEFAERFNVSIETTMVMISHGFAELGDDEEWTVRGLDRMATLYPEEYAEFVNATVGYQMIGA